MSLIKKRKWRRRQRHIGWPGWLKQIGKRALNLATVASLVFLGNNVYRYFVLTTQWKLNEIRVVGCVHAKEAELLDLARLDLGMEIWRLNLTELTQSLIKHPWIEKVQVRRDWSRQALIIEVQERTARAIILLDDLYLVDRQGKVFKKVGPKEKVDLPLLTGLESKGIKKQDEEGERLIKQALELLDLLAYRQIINEHNISEINLHKQRGLTLYTLDKSLPIYLGWGDYKDKLNRLEKVLADIQKKGEEVAYVDVNYPRKIVVKVKEKQNMPSERPKPMAQMAQRRP
ncbi:MAG: cell division protein FtsQ/DivIB [Thermodesulfobacteriota bacterium]